MIGTVLVTSGLGTSGPVSAGPLGLRPAAADPGRPTPSASTELASARSRAVALNMAVARLRLQAEVSAEAYNAVTDEVDRLRSRSLLTERQLENVQAGADRVAARNAARVRLLYQSQGGYGLLGALVAGGTPQDVLDRASVSAAVVGNNVADAAAARAATREGLDIAATLAAARGRQASLAADAARYAADVQQSLSVASAALAGADAEVVRIAAAERHAAELAAATAFAARLAEAAAGSALARTPGGGAVLGLPGPTPAAAAALIAARSRLGMPYLWGAVGPTRFDCSGLTGWAYRQAGVGLPRTSRQQWYAGPHPALGELAAGDLLFWATDVRDPATIHHVALYLGGGSMIAAPHSGDVVKVQPVYGNGYIGAVRPTAVYA